MVYSLTWLAGVLGEGGLKVAECPGWQSRGRGDVGNVRGVLCHHTAGPKDGNMPSLNTLLEGRSDLPGPLSQLGLGRDGTYYVIAAGRCNHAGVGSWQGITTGNLSFIGIEAENTGAADDAWPAVQMSAYQRGAAVILKHLGVAPLFCAGHKEFALPTGRKTDPSFSMEDFRKGVTAILAGTAPAATLIPSSTPSADGQATLQTLRRGDTGALVRKVQSAVGVEADGYFGPKTEVAVRAFQRQKDLVPDGIVGPKTWLAMNSP